MATLEEVLGRLELSDNTQDLLEQTNFDDAKLVKVAFAPMFVHSIH